MLKDSARGSSSERGGRFRATLIVGEVALSVVLLVGSSLLLMSFLKLQRTPPGFDPAGAAAAFVGVPLTRYKTPGAAGGVLQPGRRAPAREPRRHRRGRRDRPAAVGSTPRAPYSVAGRPILPLPQRPLAGLGIVSDDYFRLMRIAFVEGRPFRAEDREGAPGVCIVNESLARHSSPANRRSARS